MSDWKKAAADRRDERQVKSPSLEEPRAITAPRKDKKKWCRGKKGIEHKPVCRTYQEVKNTPSYTVNWRLLVCEECGKELNLWAPMTWRTNKIPPDWVTK